MSSVLRGCRVLLAPPKTGSVAVASVSAKEKPKSAARNSGITKPLQVSPTLASFLGSAQSSRANAVKQIWAHIKLHNLQNPANKREINCDYKLRSIFNGKTKVSFLEMGKLLNPHFVKSA